MRYHRLARFLCHRNLPWREPEAEQGWWPPCTARERCVWDRRLFCSHTPGYPFPNTKTARNMWQSTQNRPGLCLWLLVPSFQLWDMGSVLRCPSGMSQHEGDNWLSHVTLVHQKQH